MQINTGNSLNKTIQITIICLFVIACKSATSVPSGIIEINPMKELMWDIARAEIYANQIIARDTTKNLKNETIILYQKVLSLHHTTKEQFIESIKYYELHPVTQKILLDSLLQYATRMRETGLKKTASKPIKF